MSKADQQALREARRQMMLKEPLIKVVPIIAFPMIISQLVNSFYGIADTYFVSKLGVAATASIGVIESLTHFTQSVSMGFGAGASSYISRLLGAKKDDEASVVASTVLFLSMGFMIALISVFFTFLSPIVDLLGATETSKHYCMEYARFILLGAPFTGGTMVLNQILRSEGNTRLSMVGTVSGCIVNIGLDPLFINVFGLEVAGAAIATTISKMISFTILLMPFLLKRSMLELNIKNFKLRWETMKEVLKMGLPTFLRSSCMSVASTITNNVARTFGDYALASVSVGNKTMRFLESIIMGFSQGTQPVIGFCWGAKDYRRVKKTFWFIVGFGGGLAVIMGAGYSFVADKIIMIFTSSRDENVLRLGALVIRSQCIVLMFHMLVMIASSLFQALGRATSAAVLGLSRSIIVLIPSVIILPKLWGETGLGISRAAADVVSFVFIALPLLIKFLIDLEKSIKMQSQAETNS